VNIDPKNVLIATLLGLFLWSAVDGSANAAGTDGGGGDSDRGLIAVTGQFGSGASALYLIDSRTRHMSVYRVDAAGRSMSLIAARDCSYDFYLQTYGDRSELGYLPANLRSSWEKHGGRIAGPENGTTPASGIRNVRPRDAGKPKEIGPKIKPIRGKK